MIMFRVYMSSCNVYVIIIYNLYVIISTATKSETRMTANVLKPDPNTIINGFKKTLFIRTKHNM